MSAFDDIMEGLQEVRDIMHGDFPAPRITMYRHSYVPEEKVKTLVAKARALTDLLADAETHHGGLIGTKTLRAANELRLELSQWKETR